MEKLAAAVLQQAAPFLFHSFSEQNIDIDLGEGVSTLRDLNMNGDVLQEILGLLQMQVTFMCLSKIRTELNEVIDGARFEIDECFLTFHFKGVRKREELGPWVPPVLGCVLHNTTFNLCNASWQDTTPAVARKENAGRSILHVRRLLRVQSTDLYVMPAEHHISGDRSSLDLNHPEAVQIMQAGAPWTMQLTQVVDRAKGPVAGLLDHTIAIDMPGPLALHFTPHSLSLLIHIVTAAVACFFRLDLPPDAVALLPVENRAYLVPQHPLHAVSLHQPTPFAALSPSKFQRSRSLSRVSMTGFDLGPLTWGTASAAAKAAGLGRWRVIRTPTRRRGEASQTSVFQQPQTAPPGPRAYHVKSPSSSTISSSVLGTASMLSPPESGSVPRRPVTPPSCASVSSSQSAIFPTAETPARPAVELCLRLGTIRIVVHQGISETQGRRCDDHKPAGLNAAMPTCGCVSAANAQVCDDQTMHGCVQVLVVGLENRMVVSGVVPPSAHQKSNANSTEAWPPKLAKPVFASTRVQSVSVSPPDPMQNDLSEVADSETKDEQHLVAGGSSRPPLFPFARSSQDMSTKPTTPTAGSSTPLMSMWGRMHYPPPAPPTPWGSWSVRANPDAVPSLAQMRKDAPAPALSRRNSRMRSAAMLLKHRLSGSVPSLRSITNRSRFGFVRTPSPESPEREPPADLPPEPSSSHAMQVLLRLGRQALKQMLRQWSLGEEAAQQQDIGSLEHIYPPVDHAQMKVDTVIAPFSMDLRWDSDSDEPARQLRGKSVTAADGGQSLESAIEKCHILQQSLSALTVSSSSSSVSPPHITLQLAAYRKVLQAELLSLQDAVAVARDHLSHISGESLPSKPPYPQDEEIIFCPDCIVENLWDGFLDPLHLLDDSTSEGTGNGGADGHP